MDERELELKARVASCSSRAARTLGETLEPDRVYDRFHELLADVVPHDGVVVSSYDESDGLIRCEYAWVGRQPARPVRAPAARAQPRGRRHAEQGDQHGRAAAVQRRRASACRRREHVLRRRPRGNVRKLPESGPPGSQAAMMVPVKHEGRVVGVVQLMSDSGAYTHDQLELAEGLVAQMAAAVRNARLQKEQRRLEAAEAAARAAAARARAGGARARRRRRRDLPRRRRGDRPPLEPRRRAGHRPRARRRPGARPLDRRLPGLAGARRADSRRGARRARRGP